MSTELPEVHTSVHLLASRRTRRNSTGCISSDLPPAYSTLYTSTNNIEETVPRYDSEGEVRLLYDHFEDKTTRIGFYQKVLAIKLLQMLIIITIMGSFSANIIDVIRLMNKGNNLEILFVISIMIYMLMYGVMVICQKVLPRNPFRYMFLVAYPLSLSVFISVWTIYWHLLAPILLSCIYYCAVIFVLLLYSIFALQTELQFDTKCAILVALGTQSVILTFTVPFVDIKVLCPTIIMIFEYIYILYNLEAMTSAIYWSVITPADSVNGAINLHFDYFNIIHYFVIPKIINGSRRMT